VCLVFCFAIVSLGVTASNGGPNRCQKVSVTFRDQTGDCVMSDGRPGVDGSAAFVDGVENVRAYYRPDGSFDLELKQSPPFELDRHLWYDFSLTAGTGMDGSPSQPHEAPYEPAGMAWLSNVSAQVDFAGGLDAMPVGGTAHASVTLDLFLTYAFDEHLLRFDSQAYPGTANVTVTRTGPTTWTFEAGPSDAALLLQMPHQRAQEPVDCGYYYMPLSFTVEKL
jgi:hypothetical protein